MWRLSTFRVGITTLQSETRCTNKASWPSWPGAPEAPTAFGGGVACAILARRSEPMSQKLSRHADAVIGTIDPIWMRLRDEAEAAAQAEPALASLMITTILNHDRLEDAVIHRVAAPPRRPPPPPPPT